MPFKVAGLSASSSNLIMCVGALENEMIPTAVNSVPVSKSDAHWKCESLYWRDSHSNGKGKRNHSPNKNVHCTLLRALALAKRNVMHEAGFNSGRSRSRVVLTERVLSAVFIRAHLSTSLSLKLIALYCYCQRLT
jgi:hypothetical protein